MEKTDHHRRSSLNAIIEQQPQKHTNETGKRMLNRQLNGKKNTHRFISGAIRGTKHLVDNNDSC